MTSSLRPGGVAGFFDLHVALSKRPPRSELSAQGCEWREP